MITSESPYNFIDRNQEIKEIYNNVNFLLKQDNNLEFMNHGYHPVDKRLVNSSILLKNSATLYLYAINKLKLYDIKSILEVGCGRGGGISLIKNIYDIKNTYGCDISEENINYCINNHNKINFKVQDACYLNYDKKFDVILNIESSHCYSNVKNFFKGVTKHLNSNGYFLYADIFEPKDVNLIRSELEKNFSIIEEEDITENVYFSCLNSIKTLEEHLKICEFNYDAYNFVLNIFKEKKNLYKSRKSSFYIFLCKHS